SRRLRDRRLDWRHRRRPPAAPDAGQRGDAYRAGAWTGPRPEGPQGTVRDVRHDLRSLIAALEQRPWPERGGRGAADEGIRCADGEPGRVRPPRIREPLGIRITGRI